MSCDVTVIVPIYNAGKSLNLCLQSLASQSHQSIEFLLIDDGSSDSSANICTTYTLRDNRFRYFYKDNGGVSSARNYGLSLASGKFIAFVDADDTVHSDMFLLMAEQIQSVDLVICGYLLNSLAVHKMQLESKEVTQLNAENALERIITDPKVQGFVCNKLFKADLIASNQLSFNTNVHICEDLLFCVRYVLYCNTVKYMTTPFYDYRINIDGAMSQSFNSRHLTVIKAFDEMIQLKGLEPKVISLLRHRLVVISLSLLRKYLKSGSDKPDELMVLLHSIQSNSSGFISSSETAFKYKLAFLLSWLNFRLMRFI